MITACLYTESQRERWDEFVWASKTGTMMHTRQFLSYHPEGKFDDRSLMLYDDNRLVGLFPAALETEVPRGLDALERGTPVTYALRSHPGASYGGLVVKAGAGVEKCALMMRAVVDAADTLKCSRVWLRAAEPVFHHLPSDEVETAYRMAGFREEYSELSHAVPLRTEDGSPIIDSFTPECRRACRKAMKEGVSVKWAERDEEWFTFWRILEQNLAFHNTKPTHTIDEIRRLKELMPEHVELVYARAPGIGMIGGTVVMHMTAEASHTFYFGSLKEYRNLRPLNLVVLMLMGELSAHERRWLNFGISTEDEGRRLNTGLFHFKESFGGGGTLRKVWTARVYLPAW